MALTTSLAGRVRNTSLPKSHALLPLLEAVVNGLQAIDARFGDDTERGQLRVRIHRSPQVELDLETTGAGRAPLKPIVGFSVEDNGVGFTPENMKSFETLDSDYKARVGCRGVGRLLWLKAFDRVSIKSAYVGDAGALSGRKFRFSVAREVEQDGEPDGFDDAGTIVTLDGFKETYQKNASKSVDAIAREVFEHCVWYFLRPGGAPDLTVSDDEESVVLNGLMKEFVHSAMPMTTIEVNGEKFDMVNLCLKPSARNSTPRLHWCAANRVVMVENLTGKVPGLHGRLKEEGKPEFTYACYLSSAFLDDHVRSDRTAFDLADHMPDDSLLDDVTLDDIRAGALAKIEQILAVPLIAAREEGKARVNNYVANHAPRYRPVLARLESLGVTVDPTVKDQDLELELHRNLHKLEVQVLAEGQKMFAKSEEDRPEDYEERLAQYLETVKDINQSDLAAYVFRRRAILDVLATLIRSDDHGKYNREEAIHRLLIPMRKDSNELGPDASNLWIIDERLAFHDYLASDKTLKSMPITGSDSTKEPDVLATRIAGPDSPVLAAEGLSPPFPSIVVIEIKRPMLNDASEGKDPIQQCLGYVERVRRGGVKTATGRQIPEMKEPPAFCYVIADLTPRMIERCKMAGLRPTHDALGYFGFNEAYKAYTEVISFDLLIKAATERNRAFFDKLGLPTS
ncbi:Uncharacterised protein [Mycobacteroides abscessus subsp. abscessus]|uniref:ATP-binding protein n=1 Tax=Mycobacteroides abscessus TaxID=36809 RepID=UPI00092CCBA3|nr:ATP-binding protein [Mycobacteroides abscessus]SIJ48858.1 Uncharacterised protein [Mycobacteroides abscessus subsp. abscessus]SIM01151.1 Uncharacterised protein [Mycobacteroides abscessus subsp. abscessus]SLL04054.1 Uncharacterised protein [Mycobacteroides abscessus subsp. abscessus]